MEVTRSEESEFFVVPLRAVLATWNLCHFVRIEKCNKYEKALETFLREIQNPLKLLFLATFGSTLHRTVVKDFRKRL